jgi:hypothetical protein
VRASYPCVPVILVSGRIDPNVEFEFVEKPFSRAIMVSAIHRVARRAAEALADESFPGADGVPEREHFGQNAVGEREKFPCGNVC